jgi:hypothetical protein
MRLFKVLVMIGLVAGVVLAPPVAALASFGIDPGKVYIDNLYPGARAEFPITVYNQNDYEATFVVKARAPDYTAEDQGYDALPYLEWVTVNPERVTIGASAQGDVLVVVAMPKDADYSGKKSEVWISFMEEDTAGMVKIELCARLFISTRVEKPSEAQPEPGVEGGGSVGIQAEAGGAQPVSPEREGVSPWVIIGSIVGLVVGGGVAYYLMKRWQRA